MFLCVGGGGGRGGGELFLKTFITSCLLPRINCFILKGKELLRVGHVENETPGRIVVA